MSDFNIKQLSRFLDRATFGARYDDVLSLSEIGKEQWLNTQFNIPITYHWPRVIERGGGFWFDNRMGTWFDLAVFSEDQLRQRVAFALSQIVVVSGAAPHDLFGNHKVLTLWADLLLDHAFSSYKDLLRAVTFSPAMGIFLTYVDNKSAEVTGTNPDENYAREIMQLFSLGLNKLALNGEPILNNDGKHIETYTQEDIDNIAKIFTGWALNGNDDTIPMIVNEHHHDHTEKTILGEIFPANVSAEDELEHLLDVLIAQPSTAPFMCKNLIEKLVTSNPSKSYVERVSVVFQQTNGDLKSVIKAIYLDPDLEQSNAENMTKVREPIMIFTKLYRNLYAYNNHGGLCAYREFRETYNQNPYNAEDVFNFFDRNYSPDGLKNKGLISPELGSFSWMVYINIGNYIYKTLTEYNNYINNQDHDENYVDLTLYIKLQEIKESELLVNEIKNRLLNGNIRPTLYSKLLHISQNDSSASITVIARMLFISMMSNDFLLQE